jgi:phage gp29-like protein
MAANPTLYDAYGRPVRAADLRREWAAPQLGGVRTIWTDTVASGLTPGKLATLLKGAVEGDHLDFLTLAEEIEERDHHYRSVLGTRKLAVSGLEVVVEAASDEARDQELAEAVRGLARDPGFGEALFDLLDGLGKGYSVVELLWETGAARWTPHYAWRDPRFFQFDRVSRAELRLRDESAPDGVELPPYKFIAHVPHLKTGIPIRRGLARLAAWAYLFKAFTLKDWAAFVEVYGMPMRVGKYGEGATDEDRRRLIQAVVNLGTDAAAVMHESMAIEFQNAVQGSGNNELFLQCVEFWDKQVSKAVLGQTASTEGTPGKLGAEEAQDRVRLDLVIADARDLSNTLNRDLVRPFIDLNFGPQEDYPRLMLFVPKPEDLQQLTDSVSRLVPLGLRVAQSVIRDKLGLPDPGEEEDLLTAVSSPSPSGEGAGGEAAANARAGRSPERRVPAVTLTALNQGGPALAGDPTDEELDEIEREALADWEEQIAPILNPLRELVEGAESYEALKASLLDLLGRMDSDPLVRKLAEAMFQARGAGDSADSAPIVIGE